MTDINIAGIALFCSFISWGGVCFWIGYRSGCIYWIDRIEDARRRVEGGK